MKKIGYYLTLFIVLSLLALSLFSIEKYKWRRYQLKCDNGYISAVSRVIHIRSYTNSYKIDSSVYNVPEGVTCTKYLTRD